MLLGAVVELELGGQALSASWSERLVEAQPHNFTARRLLAAANWADAGSEGAAEALAPIVARADADSWSLLLAARVRSEEHTSELQSLMRISYAVFCLKKQKKRD